MQIKDINTGEARKRISELMEHAFYKGDQFRIARKNRPMARLVGEPFMEMVSKIIDYAIEHEPAIADTLAITFDRDIRAIIDEGTKEKEERKILHIETILEAE